MFIARRWGEEGASAVGPHANGRYEMEKNFISTNK